MLHLHVKHLWYVVLYALGKTTCDSAFVHTLYVGTFWRYVAHMVMNALAKWDSFSNRTRIIHKNPPASQLERELDYDNALMFSIAAFLAVKLVTPFLDYPVELSRKSIIWCFIGHFFVTEPIYYAFHRWMHIPAIFKKTHFHHHTSIVPEPNSGTSHPILENIAYMANFSFAFLVPAAAGYYSHALIGPYFVLFDILNIMGHSNFEWFPSWWYRTPMKYLLYTTTHHSLHHSRFKCNYVLFCPVWDYLFGTTHPETEATFFRVHTQKPAKLNAAFLCHGFKHNSILHTTMVSPVQATREVKDAWWHPILLPVLIPLAGICTYWGKPFTMQRYTYSGANIITRVVPHLAYDFVNKRHHASINRHLLACIREAARQGASVVGLGALNKAHFLNSGGEDLLPHLRDLKGVALVHGNTLTTAVVWDALRRRLPPRSLVVLTGPTAKIGAALTRLLIRDGHTVQALTSDRARFDALRDSLADLGDKTAFDRLKLLTHISQGHDFKYWVLGKACRIEDVAHIKSEAHVFEYAVPRIDTSLTGKFRNYCAIGAMAFDKAKTDLNFCHDVPGTVPACLAATIIHALEGTTEHEVSSVPSDTATMERWLSLAKKHGFTSAELDSSSTIKSVDWEDKDGKRSHQEFSSPRSIVLDDGTITFSETPVRLNSSKLASTGTQPVSKRDFPPIYEWTFSALLSLLPAFAVFTATVAFLEGPLPSVEISTSAIIRSFVF